MVLYIFIVNECARTSSKFGFYHMFKDKLSAFFSWYFSMCNFNGACRSKSNPYVQVQGVIKKKMSRKHEIRRQSWYVYCVASLESFVLSWLCKDSTCKSIPDLIKRLSFEFSISLTTRRNKYNFVFDDTTLYCICTKYPPMMMTIEKSIFVSVRVTWKFHLITSCVCLQ